MLIYWYDTVANVWQPIVQLPSLSLTEVNDILPRLRKEYVDIEFTSMPYNEIGGTSYDFLKKIQEERN